MKRLLIALALLTLAVAPASAQGPANVFPYYLHSRAMAVGTVYPNFFTTGGNQSPVLAVEIVCTAPGNVVLALGDNISTVTVNLPQTGTYIIQFQVTQIVSAGTTAAATYAQVG